MCVGCNTRHVKREEIIAPNRIHDHTFFSLACHSQKPLGHNCLFVKRRRHHRRRSPVRRQIL